MDCEFNVTGGIFAGDSSELRFWIRCSESGWLHGPWSDFQFCWRPCWL